ncbi:MAG: hypothetical protein Q4G65_09260 [bacterium]|nr:hypothetical protein [bacterium]
MSMTINPNMNTNYVNGATGIEPQVIDVKTGEGSNRAGILVTVADVGEISDVEGELTPSQEADLEALLALLGLDGENAKSATMQTVLKAIQAAIKQQAISVTTCTTAISDYDVTRLEALKKAMQGSDDPNAQKIIDNVDRMMELKKEIEDLANNKGMTYDGKFEGVDPNPNFELNTRVREMGDRIADIRHYKGCMGGDKMDALLNTLAPAMKTAVKDLLAAYDKTSGWGVQVNITYSKMTSQTLSSFANFIASNDLKFPPQISKDALLQILKEISEELGPNATAQQIDEKMEEKMAEIIAQLQDIDIPVQA